MRGLGPTLGSIRARQPFLSISQHPVIQRSLEHGQAGLGLIEGNLMSGFVDPREAEIAILPDLAVFDVVDDEGRVAGCVELLGVRVVDLLGDGLAAEPVADVVGVAVHEGDAHVQIEQVLEIGDVDGVGEVAGVREALEDEAAGGGGVVEVDAEGILDLGRIEIVDEVFGWSGCVGGQHQYSFVGFGREKEGSG